MPPKYKKKKNKSKKTRTKNKKEDDNSNRINSDVSNSDNNVSKMIETVNLNSNTNNNVSSNNNAGWTDPSLLRFCVGKKVECSIGGEWFLGKVIKVNFKHKDWDHYVPYEMVLLKDKNHNNHTTTRRNSGNKYDYDNRASAPKDSDEYIREPLFETAKEQKQTKGWTDPSLLRFRVGTKVETITQEGWLSGEIIKVNYKEGGWDYYVPYQIELSVDNRRFYATEDCNDVIRESNRGEDLKRMMETGAGRGRGRRKGDSALIALPLSCYHGSNLADFKNVEYIEAMQSYTLLCSDIRNTGQDDSNFKRLQKFNDDHKHLMMLDADFCRFTFSYCTIFYQKYFHLSYSYKMDLASLLSFGIKMRYIDQVEKRIDNVGPGSENYEKSDKYHRDICSERGVIKCLARETPCDCMNSKKKEAQGMEKTNICNGCPNAFRKDQLFNCTGCQIVKYCSKTCQVNAWPNHRDSCKNQQQLIKMKKELKEKGIKSL